MNSLLSRLLFYYPSTLLKGEPIAFLSSEYSKNQYKALDEIKSLQLFRLKKITKIAYENSEFYRKLYDERGFDPYAIKGLEDLTRIPTIGKSDLIDSANEITTSGWHFLASSKTTGGSTGEPVRLIKNPMALARERTATNRGYNWAGITLGDSQLRLWGIPHGRNDAWKSKIIDLVANRKRISAFELTDQNLHNYYLDARKFKPKFIYGYVSAVNEFAHFIVRHNLAPIESLKCIVTTSEVLTDADRSNIEGAFKVKVYNEYGCGEVGSIAHECENGSLHIVSDNLIVETDSRKGEAGELIVTDLFNKVTPLIRYRIGDYGTLSEQKCDCGRTLPLLQSVHGRAYDLLLMPDGRQVHPESAIYVFEDLQKVDKFFSKFQVIQTSVDELVINVVPTSRYTKGVEKEIIENLKIQLHAGLNVKVNLVAAIEREASGKMRVVKRAF